MEAYKNNIILDGRMDEAAWKTAKEYSNFTHLKKCGGEVSDVQTFFKVLTYEDRIFMGIKCMAPNLEELIKIDADRSVYHTDSVEIFLCPSGNGFDCYQFAITVGGRSVCNFYSESGVTKPDPYAPDWKYAVHYGDKFWTVEIEWPLTAFYMTPHSEWQEEWLLNISHTCKGVDLSFTSWSALEGAYLEPRNFNHMGGFPMRPACDDVRICSVVSDITEETENGYNGTVTVKTQNHEAGEFVFSSPYAESVTVALQAGANEFKAPCHFEELARCNMPLTLKRVQDGVEFSRHYPVRVTYEPIALKLTLPEYRNNFYPGQDATRVVGQAISSKKVTLKLEGPGIETQVISPDADGNFVFETPNFEIGEAFLTATIDGYEIVKKIRRLAPSGNRTAWISGGNLIVDGEPVLRRNMYATGYHGGTAFKRKISAGNYYTTENVGDIGSRDMQPEHFLRKAGLPTGEMTRDIVPSKAVFDGIDAVIDAHKGKDYVFYYLCDEPEYRLISNVYLKHIYDYICEKDPYHVVLMASTGPSQYVECCDWFETHPYITVQEREGRGRYYTREFSVMGKYVDAIALLNRPDKCIGFLPTCFSYRWSNIYATYPNFDEYICHTWAAMIHGGKTLWPYAYHDLNDRASLYEGTRYLFSSFEALDKLVLFAKRTVLYRTDEAEAVLYDKGDEKMFVLVNFTTQHQQVKLDGISGEWYEFRHNRKISGNVFALKPHEVVIGTSEVKDAGLPTYEEVTALVDKLEYERTHGGSLLFNRSDDLTFIASTAKQGQTGIYKMFDGVRDNWAWALVGGSERFYELNLTKVKPNFSKVVVHGYHLDDMQLKVRNNGELSVPGIAEIQTEEFSTTFILKEAICPDCLRFEFPLDKVELYEIEVF